MPSASNQPGQQKSYGREDLAAAFQGSGDTSVPPLLFEWQNCDHYQAEHAMDARDVVIHFFYPPLGCTEAYWSQVFPSKLLEALHTVFGSEAEKMCKARRCNGFEIDSWWLRCYGMSNRFLDPMDQVKALYTALAAALSNTNTRELGCCFHWHMSQPRALAEACTRERIRRASGASGRRASS